MFLWCCVCLLPSFASETKNAIGDHDGISGRVSVSERVSVCVTLSALSMSPRTGSSSVGDSSSPSEAAMTSSSAPSSSVAADNGCNGGGGGRRFTVRERGPVELQEVQI